MSEKYAKNPTKVSENVGKIRLYLSRAKGRFNRIKVGNFPTILLNKVGHLDPGSLMWSCDQSHWVLLSALARLFVHSASPVWPGEAYNFSAHNLIDGNWNPDQVEKSCYHSEVANIQSFVWFLVDPLVVIKRIEWQLRAHHSTPGGSFFCKTESETNTNWVFFSGVLRDFCMSSCELLPALCPNHPEAPLWGGRPALRMRTPPGSPVVDC